MRDADDTPDRLPVRLGEAIKKPVEETSTG